MIMNKYALGQNDKAHRNKSSRNADNLVSNRSHPVTATTHPKAKMTMSLPADPRPSCEGPPPPPAP